MANRTTLQAPAAESARPLLDAAAVTEFSRVRGESATLATWRARAATVLAETTYPDRVRHLWRYTDPDRLLPGKLLTATESSAVSDVHVPDSPAVVLEAGQAPRLNAAAEACGLTVTALHDDADVTAALGRAVPAEHGYFEAINAAAFDAGLVIRAPRNLDLKTPLRVVIAARPVPICYLACWWWPRAAPASPSSRTMSAATAAAW